VQRHLTLHAVLCRLYIVHHPRIAPSDIVVMASTDALPLSGVCAYVAPLEPQRDSYTSAFSATALRLVKRGCFSQRSLPPVPRFTAELDYAAATASTWRSIVPFENPSSVYSDLSYGEFESALRTSALPHALASLRTHHVRSLCKPRRTVNHCTRRQLRIALPVNPIRGRSVDLRVWHIRWTAVEN
jgi:hypothetical protein